jgi:hypothetical protein
MKNRREYKVIGMVFVDTEEDMLSRTSDYQIIEALKIKEINMERML